MRFRSKGVSVISRQLPSSPAKTNHLLRFIYNLFCVSLLCSANISCISVIPYPRCFSPSLMDYLTSSHKTEFLTVKQTSLTKTTARKKTGHSRFLYINLFIVVIHGKHSHEGFLRHLHTTDGLHALLSFLLLLQKLFLTGDIPSIAFRQHVFSQ